jgi:hypothetical protein
MGRHACKAVLGLFLLLGLLAPLAAAPSFAQPAPTVLNRTYGDWSAAWWKWALAIPAATNPMSDPTGAFCDIGQAGDVWFLAGVLWGGTAERTCTIPSSRYIFFPIANSNWVQTFWDDPSLTEPDWRQWAETFLPFAGGGSLEATLDGKKIVFDPMTPIVRSQSPVFTATFPADNIFGMDPAGLTGYPIVSDGYWVMLPPLAPGLHELRFRASWYDYGELLWKEAQSVVYHLNITGPPPRHELKILVGPSGTPNPSGPVQSVPLSVTVVDTHGHPLTYLWQSVCADVTWPGTFSPNANAAAPTWTPPPGPFADTLNCLIRVTVVDTEGLIVQGSYVQKVWPVGF